MGHGVGLVVGKGEKSFLNSEGLKNLSRLPMEGEQGLSQGVVLHFNIRPLNTVSKPPSYGFEESLLCCKPGGKAFRGPGPLLTPIDLVLCKDPRKKEISPAGHETLNTTTVDNINTRSYDHILAFFAPSKWGALQQ